MKLIVTQKYGKNDFWNINSDVLKQHTVIVLNFGKGVDVNTTHYALPDISRGLGQSVWGSQDPYHRILSENLSCLVNMFEKNEDILVLSDITPESLYIFQKLRTIANQVNINLHFWGLWPFQFEGKKRDYAYADLMSGIGDVKSLKITWCQDFMKQFPKSIGMIEAFHFVGNLLENELDDIIRQIKSLEDRKTYLYDNQKQCYTDIAGYPNHKFTFRDKLEIHQISNGQIDIKNIIKSSRLRMRQYNVVRSDSKEMCKMLRNIRVQFAQNNNIEFRSQKCLEKELCAGVCEACDEESLYLRKMSERNHSHNIDANEIEIDAPICGIDRIRVDTDGPGIRTLVLFQGCPLNCVYCINKECTDSNSRTEIYKVSELLKAVEVDDIYFIDSGGGITFGGGEPLLQWKFIQEFCSKKPKEWTIIVETCLNVPWNYIEPLLSIVDRWIIDIKDMNWYIYEKYTGNRNVQVIENLEKMSNLIENGKIHIRVPQIPGYNTEKDIEESLEKLKTFSNIEVFSYIINEKDDPEATEFARKLNKTHFLTMGFLRPAPVEE